MHDKVVAFLVARGLVQQMDSHLVSVEHSDFLKRLYVAATENHLFSASVNALRELADIQITNKMLEGW